MYFPIELSRFNPMLRVPSKANMVSGMSSGTCLCIFETVYGSKELDLQTQNGITILVPLLTPGDLGSIT